MHVLLNMSLNATYPQNTVQNLTFYANNSLSCSDVLQVQLHYTILNVYCDWPTQQPVHYFPWSTLSYFQEIIKYIWSVKVHFICESMNKNSLHIPPHPTKIYRSCMHCSYFWPPNYATDLHKTGYDLSKGSVWLETFHVSREGWTSNVIKSIKYSVIYNK